MKKTIGQFIDEAIWAHEARFPESKVHHVECTDMGLRYHIEMGATHFSLLTSYRRQHLQDISRRRVKPIRGRW